jgi:hypothetical protein
MKLIMQFFQLPVASVDLVDLKFTLRFYIKGSLLSAVLGICGRSWNVSPADTGGLLCIKKEFTIWVLSSIIVPPPTLKTFLTHRNLRQF